MAGVEPKAGRSACVGMLAGMLLLGLAATLLVLAPSSVIPELETLGDGAARRLQIFPNATATATAANDALRDTMFHVTASTWGGAATQLLISLCFAFLYKKNTVDEVIKKFKGNTLEDLNNEKGMVPTGADDFENGICGCFDDLWVCIHGLCCPLVRIAHTNAVSGILGYWETIGAFFCCGLICPGIGPGCLMILWRRKLKEIMRLEDNLLCDCLVTLFCPNLSLCQAATAVDRELGYEVVGCCDLEWAED